MIANKVATERRGGVLIVAINRPEVRNCVDAETAQALEDEVRRFADDDALKVLVFTSTGEKAFCSGADLRDLGAIAGRASAWTAGPLGFTRLSDIGKPTIAAIEGYCTAGGVEVACWFDFRIAAVSARFGILNRRWGVPLLDGGTQRLPRIVGLGNALYLISTGVLIDAPHAARMGLVQEVVPDGQTLERALHIAEALCTYPQTGLRNDRRAALEGVTLPLDRGLARELEVHQATLGDPELLEAVARFATGQRPEPLRPPESADDME